VYDSTQVQVNGGTVATLQLNTERQPALVQVPVMSSGMRSIVARGYRGGTQYTSVTRTIDAVALQPTRVQYANDFEAPTSDFTGNGFTIATDPGFTGNAIHSLHNYPDNTTLKYMLTIPIKVASANAQVLFDDVALVEPGEPGTVFGDPSFYDYVVVE